MLPFEQRLIALIQENIRYAGRPCPTRVLVNETGQCPRTVKWWLHRMEEQGRVARLTPNTGWWVKGSTLDRRIAAARQLGEGEFLRWVQHELGLYRRAAPGRLRRVLQ